MQSVAQSTAQIGQVIDGRYRIVGVLGTGGMGSVYRAEHMTIRRPVAVKLLHKEFAEDPVFAKRFEREAFVTGRTDHPNCVNVSDFGRLEDGSLYLVMELVDGTLLADVLDREQRVPWQRALRICRHVLRGLGHAHEASIVHRDVKPENVIISDRDGDRDFAKLLDFGVAKLVGDSKEVADNQLTRVGTTVGTPTYVSPEQALGQPVDGRSDLYSLTVMLFEMIAGIPPYKHDDTLKVLSMHVAGKIPALADKAPGIEVPPGVDALIQRGLQKDRDHRPASADEYIAAIDALIGSVGEVSAGEPAPVERVPAHTPAPHAVHTPAPAFHTPAPAVHTPAPGSEPALSLGTDATAPHPAHTPAPRVYPPIGLAIASWSPRTRALIAAGAVLGLVLVIALIGSGSTEPNKRKGPSRTNVVTPMLGLPAISTRPSKLAKEAADLMARGEPKQTIELLEKKPAAIAGDPDAQLELGHAHAAVGSLPVALRSYAIALSLDDKLASDAKLRANVSLAADGKEPEAMLAGLDFQIRFLEEEPARSRIAQIASSDKRLSVRKSARELADKHGASDRVDFVSSYSLDLEQEGECEVRRDVIAKLLSLRDKRAIKPIQRARDRRRGGFLGIGARRINSCLIKEADAALAMLKSIAD